MLNLYKISKTYMPAVHTSGTRHLDQVKWLVLHDMENANYLGADEATGSWFKNNASTGSSHFGIDNDSIQQYLRLDRIAWGAPGANEKGVHIEQMGVASWERSIWFNKAAGTISRTAWLLAWLKLERFGWIPLVHLSDDDLRAGHSGIVTHRQLTRVFKTPGGHTDPGTGYPLAYVIQLAKAYASQKGDFMPDTTYELPPEGGGEGGGSFLTRKMGPLPFWVWAVIGVIIGYIVLTKFNILGGIGGGAAPSESSAGGSQGETGMIDSPANASEILTAWESMISQNAADIAKLEAYQKRDTARDIKQGKRITTLEKKHRKKTTAVTKKGRPHRPVNWSRLTRHKGPVGTAKGIR